MSFLFSSTEHRLRLGWRLLAHLLLLVALYFAAAIFLSPFLLVFDLRTSYNAQFILDGAASLFAITTSVFLARRRLDKRPFISLGLNWDRRALRDLLAGIGITGLAISGIYLAETALGWLHFNGFAWQDEQAIAIIGNLLLYLLVFIIVGWQEELLCRGYWLQNLSEGLGAGWGVLISSCAFAVLHSLNPNVSPMAVILLIGAGIFMASGYVRTHRLWLPIGLHIGWNFFEGTVFGFSVSGTSPFALIRQVTTGPKLFTGGAFGPEAGLIVLPALGLGLLLIYWYTKK